MRIAEETLNHLADTYLKADIGRVLNVSFYHYAQRPQHYNELYRQYQKGEGINITNGQPRLASVH